MKLIVQIPVLNEQETLAQAIAAIPDAPLGFRAYARDAAARLCVITTSTYTLETIIQAGRKRISMTSVPVSVNTVTRPSRLFNGIREYVMLSMVTISRVFVIYAPMRLFFFIAAVTATPAVIAILRFLDNYIAGEGGGNVQSLFPAAALLAMATIFVAVGIFAYRIAANRALLEDIRARELPRNVRDQLPEHNAKAAKEHWTA